MGARTLEARLTARLLSLGGGVLVALGLTAVVVTDRVLDASDTAAAHAQAAAARDGVDREVGEGDALDNAIDETISVAHAQGARLAVRRGGSQKGDAASGGLPDLTANGCATTTDVDGRPWRACAVGGSGATIVAAVPITAHRAAVGALSRGMGAVVLAALVALWMAVRRAIRAPVAELTSLVDWTERIVDAEKPLEPPVSRTREIAQLEGAFDALVRRLLETLARERANSAHIAHELRTPLTAVMAELEGTRAADDASREAIARVREGLARLADVIEAILVLSDRVPATARGDAIVNVADIARELAPSGARVDAPDEALVEGDERLLALATRNLVDNAKKYGAGVRVVRVSREGAAVSLSVIDGGPGLDAGARERMFERYWRGAADGDGSGLGLALVKAVAERHGGEARAKPGPGGVGLEVAMTVGEAVGWSE
jgi:signal transduction histidine kinase